MSINIRFTLFGHVGTAVIYVLVNSLVLTIERTLSTPFFSVWFVNFSASSAHFMLRLPARTGASNIRCEMPFSSASCVSVARHGIVVLRSYT